MVSKKQDFKTRLAKVDPRDLVLLDVNARFMRHEQFNRLVDNVKRDGALTSVPLAVAMEDGRFEVISGNHRTQAAIEAGITEIDVMLIDDVLPKAQRTAMQIAHNAIAGEDDPAVLKALYEDLDEIDWREYSGLDDKALGLLADVQIGSLSEANLEFQSMSITFLPPELDRLREVMQRAMSMSTGADVTWVAKLDQHSRFLTALSEVSKSHDVSNVATGLELILDIFEAHVEELQDGWYDSVTEKVRHGNKYVPLPTVVGHNAPAENAAAIKKAIDVARGGDSSMPAEAALAAICRGYLAK